MSRPHHIGLTGNIGSGKSTVAQLLVAKGAALIDADALAREATQSAEVLAEIAAQLGAELVVDGQLDRADTAAKVFGNEAARRTLNGIVHPWVRRESARRAEVLTGEDAPPVIIFDIPLLYENGLETTLDAVIVVDAPLNVRSERAAARSGLSVEEVCARDNAQLPLEQKVARADYVLDNAATLEHLQTQVDVLWPRLLSRESSTR